MGLYVPQNVPLDYKYIRVSNDYIDFFNVSSATNTTLNYYRQYFKYSPDLVIQRQETFSGYNTTYFTEVQVNHNLLARNDADKVLTCVFILVFFFIMLFNLFSSFIKKGGVLSGLF